MNDRPDEPPLLHLAIITYNRAMKLERVLSALAQSCLASCPITIYDNASTDDTPATIDRYRSALSKLSVVRHPRNIGAGGNLLRAYTDAFGRYFWLLCDDDSLNPELCAEILGELERATSDLVLVNAIDLEGFEPGFRGRLREVAEKGWRYFWLAAFVPSTIYRTSLLTSSALQTMLPHLRDYYPHAALAVECFEADCQVYVANPAILRREASHDIGTDWVAYTYGWLRSLEDSGRPETRRTAFWHRFGPDENWWSITMKSAAYMLAFKNEPRINVLRMWLNLPGDARLRGCPILGFLLLPRALLRVLGQAAKPQSLAASARVLAG